MSTIPIPTTPVLCGSRRYGGGECAGPAKFDVVYRSGDGTTELDRRPACFTHGMNEVDRHLASAGMARCDIEERRA